MKVKTETPVDNGWIKLYRKSIDSRVFQSEGLWKVWSWCLLKANHKDSWIPVRTGRGTTQIQVKRGQLLFGRNMAAKELKMVGTTVRKRILLLKKMGNCDIKSDTHFSLVTVLNYDLYQGNQSEEVTGKVTGKCQPSDTYKNIKENEENEENYTIMRTNGAGFESFWKSYPKKKSKGQAEKAWKTIKPNEQLLATMLATIERAKTSEDWIKENGKWIPYPATWLNAKGWEDEIKPEQLWIGHKQQGADSLLRRLENEEGRPERICEADGLKSDGRSRWEIT